MKGCQRLVALALAFVCLTGAALAQTPTRDRPFPKIDGARAWGPFLVDLSFNIDNIGYDDNVFLTAPDDPNQQGSVVVFLGPEIRAQTQFGPRIALTLHDKLSGEVYFDVSELNAANNDFDAQLDVLLGSLLLTTKGRWATTRQRPSNEFDERARRDLTSVAQTIRFFFGSKTDISATGTLERQRYTDPDLDQSYFIDPDGDGTFVNGSEGVSIGEALDYDLTELAGEIGWRPFGKTRFFAVYTYREYDFVSDLAQRDSEENRQALGLEFRPASFLNGRIVLGRALLENTEPALVPKPEDYDDLYGEVRVTYRPTGRSRFQARYERDPRFSTFERNFYYENEFGAFDVEWFLASRWGLQAGVSRRYLDWPEPTTITRDENGETGFLRSDTVDDVYGGFLFVFRSGLALGLRVGRRERDSNVVSARDEQSYVSTTGSITF